MSDWDHVGYVISSRYRVAVMRELSRGPRTPTKIAEGCETGIANVSRALQGLRERSLVELLVSEDRKKGRVYGFTDRGHRVWEQIESQNLADQP